MKQTPLNRLKVGLNAVKGLHPGLVLLLPAALFLGAYTLWVFQSDRLTWGPDVVETRGGVPDILRGLVEDAPCVSTRAAGSPSLEIGRLQGPLGSQDRTSQGTYRLDLIQFKGDEQPIRVSGLEIEIPPSSPFMDLTSLQSLASRSWMDCLSSEDQLSQPIRLTFEGQGRASPAPTQKKPGWLKQKDATLLEAQDLRLSCSSPGNADWCLDVARLNLERGKVLFFRTPSFLDCRMEDVRAEFPWRSERVVVQATEGAFRVPTRKVALGGAVEVRFGRDRTLRTSRLEWDLDNHSFAVDDRYQLESPDGVRRGRRGMFDYSLQQAQRLRGPLTRADETADNGQNGPQFSGHRIGLYAEVLQGCSPKKIQ